MGGQWFQERKEILIRELVANFIDAWAAYRAIHSNYKHQGLPDYKSCEKWIGTENKKGPLWRLKDLSNSIARRAESQPNMYEGLFDWTLGSIFHECLKIREDVYRLTHPLDVAFEDNGVSFPEIREAVKEWESRMAQIRVALRSALNEVDKLFSSSWKALKGTLLIHRDMGLVMRYLTENKDRIVTLLGSGGWEAFMEGLHPMGEADTWYLAGISYNRSGWPERAADAYRKALSIRSDHPRADEMKLAIDHQIRQPG